jgi:hypothetical protein
MALTTAVWAYVGYNVVASIVGLAVKLPDLPATHAHTDRLSLGQVLFTNGTIMSPPLVLMIVVVLLLIGSSARRLWLARICTGLLIVGVGVTAVDEAVGFGDKPALYSQDKWDLALSIGSMFLIVAAMVVIAGAVRIYASRRPQPIT